MQAARNPSARFSTCTRCASVIWILLLAEEGCPNEGTFEGLRHRPAFRPFLAAAPHLAAAVGGEYAAGDTAANVFGWAYPSGGGTLGNGMVVVFLAGRQVGSQAPRTR